MKDRVFTELALQDTLKMVIRKSEDEKDRKEAAVKLKESEEKLEELEEQLEKLEKAFEQAFPDVKLHGDDEPEDPDDGSWEPPEPLRPLKVCISLFPFPYSLFPFRLSLFAFRFTFA